MNANHIFNNKRPGMLFAGLTFLLVFKTISFADEGIPTSLNITTTDPVHSLILETYQNVLQRAPDDAGLQLYTNYMLNEGKDAEWLQSILLNSEEGRRLQAQKKSRFKLRLFTGFTLLSVTVLSLLFRKRLSAAFKKLASKLTDPQKRYMARPLVISPFATILALLLFYTSFKSTPPNSWLLYGVIICVCLTALKLPRWAGYTLIICGFIALITWGTFIDANGGQDAASDRDDAVEIAAKALLKGENPWSHKSILGLPITTGPSSIFMALPFVSLFGNINGLTLIMWCVFIFTLAYGDILLRNNTFFTACLLLVFPRFGFFHTLHWSLDELYFAAILSPLLWLTLCRKKLALAGLVGAFMVFARLSYAPAVISAGFWWLLNGKHTLSDFLKIILGGIGYILSAFAVCWMVGGTAFLSENFWENSQMAPLSDNNNLVTSFLSSLLDILPQGTLGSGLCILFFCIIVAFALREIPHPFYHMAIASALAHTIAFSPGFPMDYQLTFLIPLMYGLCFSSPDNKTAPEMSLYTTGTETV